MFFSYVQIIMVTCTLLILLLMFCFFVTCSLWNFIKAEMSRFSGYMAAVIRSNRSDMADSDKVLIENC
jgi:hypothetical protein